MEIEKAKTGRTRTKVACEECRKNKRKCGGEKPICALCMKTARICVYLSDPRKKFSDETLIRNLESQVRALESVITAQAPTGADSKYKSAYITSASPRRVHEVDWSLGGFNQDVSQTPTSQSSQLPTQVPGAAYQGSDIRSHVAMEELASLMLTMKLKDQGEPSFTISSGDSRISTDVYAGAAAQGHVTLPTPCNDDLKSNEQRGLVKNFMKCFNGFHQLLNEDEAIVLASHEPFAGSLDEQFRNYAFFAVAVYLADGVDSVSLGQKYADRADSMASKCIREFPSDLVVQGLSLLSWRELQLGNDSMCYNYIAMATGQILYQGLHVTALRRPKASLKYREPTLKRRVRTFWAYFSIDRLVTSSIGMNCTMHWQRVKPPSFLSTIDEIPSIDHVAHEEFCQLWHVWDSCMDQVHAFGWAELSGAERKTVAVRSHQALQTYYQQINPRLHLTKDAVSAGALWFHLSFQTAVLLIHRPLLNEPLGSFTLDFALRSATSAAAAISGILRKYRKHVIMQDVLPQVIEYVLSAAIIHLLNATSGKTALGRQSANGLRTCLDVLQDMSSRWKVRVQRSIIRVRQLAHRWKVVWALPLSLSYPLNITDTEDEQYRGSTSDSPRNAVQDMMAVDLFGGDRANISVDHAGDILWESTQYDGALEQINNAIDGSDWSLAWLFQENGWHPDANFQLYE